MHARTLNSLNNRRIHLENGCGESESRSSADFQTFVHSVEAKANVWTNEFQADDYFLLRADDDHEDISR
jgi:hypothetical protein